MRLLIVALAGPMILLGGAAVAQQRPSEDEIACKLLHDCGSGQKAPENAPASDGSVVIGGEERTFCFGGSGCGHPTKPTVAPQRLVTSTHPMAAVGNARPQRAAAHVARFIPAANSATAATGSGSAAMDMALTFPNASADLSASARDQIAAFARVLMKRAPTTLSFRVDGHTNAVGTRDNNLDLSRRRAQAVVDYMVTLGVAKDRLEPKGLGFDDPIRGSKPTDSANRRVEIVAK